MPTLFATRLGSVIPITLAILLVTAAVHAQIPCAYEVTAVIQGPWCPIFGFPPTYGRGITEDGAVVGHYTSCLIGPSEAFYWSESTGFVTLSRPPGFSSAAALGVDDQGSWIVGAMTPQGANVSTAVLWVDGVAIDLGTLPGGNFSQARATYGDKIVGKWGNNVTGDPGLAAFLWQDGQMLNIHADLGTPNSEAWDVNTAGQVTGWMGQSFLVDSQAFIWQDGQVTALPNPTEIFAGRANAISSDGEIVVGSGQFDDGSTFGLARAILWENERPIVLGTLPGTERSSASDVRVDNSIMQIVGGSGGAGFVWQSGVMTDLNTLIPQQSDIDITSARAINSQGQIAAQGHNQDGDVVALLLTPSEPPLGDLNGDCHVGILDLLGLLADWGMPDSTADLNNDAIVNVLDLLILLENWG